MMVFKVTKNRGLCRQRVLEYRGQAIDIPARNEWKQETVSGVELTAEAPTFSSGMIASSLALGSVVASPDVMINRKLYCSPSAFPPAAHLHPANRGYNKSPRLGFPPWGGNVKDRVNHALGGRGWKYRGSAEWDGSCPTPVRWTAFSLRPRGSESKIGDDMREMVFLERYRCRRRRDR